MPSVFPTPLSVWSKREQTRYKTNDAVRFFGFEERTMTTVMEDDEGSNHKQATKHGNWKAQPKRDVFQEIEGNPYGKNGDKGVDQLPNGSTDVRVLKFGDERGESCDDEMAFIGFLEEFFIFSTPSADAFAPMFITNATAFLLCPTA